METVLVTGGAGFIGSNLVENLLGRGYRVVVVDNFADDLYNPKFKDEHISRFIDNQNFALHRVDICDLAKLKSIFEIEKPKYVAHLAAKANTRKAVGDPYVYMDVNIVGTLNILELCKDYKVENLAIASSSSVYGNSQNVPWKETDSADQPLSPYGMTKRADEILAYTYHHNFSLNITCLRYFNAYGENNRPDLVPYIWGEAILTGKEIEISGDGSRRRDYTYVGDVAEATALALEKPLGFSVINIGDSNPVSLKELLAIFEKVTGLKANVKVRESHHSSVESTYADVSKAKELLGWEPKTNIEEGITKLVSWLRDNRLKNTL